MFYKLQEEFVALGHRCDILFGDEIGGPRPRQLRQAVDPWYAGRSEGRSGRGRSVNGIAVYDSMAWLRMSRPVDAATAAGIVRVLSGSSSPSVR